MNYLGDQYESFIVDCFTSGGGKSGGLIFLWNPDFNVEIEMHDLSYIDTVISSSIDNSVWRYIGMYGYPQHHNKFLACDTITNLSSNNWNPNWLIFGDFDVILNSSEKLGGNPPGLNITQMFRDTINVCNLNDLGFSCDIFTWANNHDHDNSHMKCRLDRFLATPEWISLFPNHSNTHFIKFGSDHNPILLEFSKFNHDRSKFHKVQRFEQIWLNNEGHNKVVQQTWANSQIPIAQRLSLTLTNMSNWGKETFGNIHRRIGTTQEALGALYNMSDQQGIMTQIKDKEKELDE